MERNIFVAAHCDAHWFSSKQVTKLRRSSHLLAKQWTLHVCSIGGVDQRKHFGFDLRRVVWFLCSAVIKPRNQRYWSTGKYYRVLCVLINLIAFAERHGAASCFLLFNVQINYSIQIRRQMKNVNILRIFFVCLSGKNKSNANFVSTMNLTFLEMYGDLP